MLWSKQDVEGAGEMRWVLFKNTKKGRMV